MNAIFHFLLKHGYSVLFAATLAHQLGIPLPGPLFLVAAGALAGTGKLGIPIGFGLAVSACVLADWVWYEAGRKRGEKVLHFMHQFTGDPDFHDRNAKRIFARYGPPLLLVAKLIPGFDAVAPPLAGISRTSRIRFLAFDAAGAGLYTSVYGGLGYLFRNDLDRAAAYVSRAGTLLLGVAIIGICIYFAYRKLVQRLRLVRKSRLGRIGSADPAEHGLSVGLPYGAVEGHKHGD